MIICFCMTIDTLSLLKRSYPAFPKGKVHDQIAQNVQSDLSSEMSASFTLTQLNDTILEWSYFKISCRRLRQIVFSGKFSPLLSDTIKIVATAHVFWKVCCHSIGMKN